MRWYSESSHSHCFLQIYAQYLVDLVQLITFIHWSSVLIVTINSINWSSLAGVAVVECWLPQSCVCGAEEVCWWPLSFFTAFDSLNTNSSEPSLSCLGHWLMMWKNWNQAFFRRQTYLTWVDSRFQWHILIMVWSEDAGHWNLRRWTKIRRLGDWDEQDKYD